MAKHCIAFLCEPKGDVSTEGPTRLVHSATRLLGGEQLYSGKKAISDAGSYLAMLVERYRRSRERALGVGIFAFITNSKTRSDGAWGIGLHFGSEPTDAMRGEEVTVVEFGGNAAAWLDFESCKSFLVEGAESLGSKVAVLRNLDNEDRVNLPEDACDPRGIWPPGLLPGALTYAHREIAAQLELTGIPAHTVAESASGLVVELTHGFFDDAREDHRAIQGRAVRYLNLEPTTEGA